MSNEKEETTQPKTAEEAAKEIKKERTFTEVEDFELEAIDFEGSVLRVGGYNRKAPKCDACNKFPVTNPDKYSRIAKNLFKANGKIEIEGFSLIGVGVATGVAKNLREELKFFDIKTKWKSKPLLIKVVDEEDNVRYQFGSRLTVEPKKK